MILKSDSADSFNHWVGSRNTDWHRKSIIDTD